MMNKKINELTIKDIMLLKSNKISESKILEYKLKLPGNSDSDKKEFLKDVSSFANTSGGDLIYGVLEDKGLIKSVPGLKIVDIDKEKLRLDSLINQGIQPKIKSEITVIDLNKQKKILIIRIPKSWISPHRVTLGGHDKFYARNSAGKYPLDVFELKEMFRVSESIIEKIRDFVIQRKAELINNETPIEFAEDGKIIIHLIPIENFSSEDSLPLEELELRELKPIRSSTGWSDRITFEGRLTYVSSGEGKPSYSYTHYYRNGVIEAVVAFFRPRYGEEHKRQIPHIIFEEIIIKALGQYLNMYKKLKILPPVFCFLTFTGIKGYTMSHDSGDYVEINKDVISLPEIFIEDFDQNADKILQPSFDLMWNACNREKSPNYDENGNWSPKQ